MLCKPQLGKAAQHAVRFHTAQLALADLDAARQLRHMQRSGHEVTHLQILRARDDLHRIFRAHIHLAHHHMVGIRMRNDLQYFADDDVFDGVGLAFISFHLAAAHGHAIGKFLRGAGEIGEFSRPVDRHFHLSHTPFSIRIA